MTRRMTQISSILRINVEEKAFGQLEQAVRRVMVLTRDDNDPLLQASFKERQPGMDCVRKF